MKNPGIVALLCIAACGDPTKIVPSGAAASSSAAPGTAPGAATAPVGAAVETCPSDAALRDPAVRALLLPALGDLPADGVRVVARPWKVEPPMCVVMVATTERANARLAALAILAPGPAPIADRLVASTGPLPLAADEVGEAPDVAPYVIREGDRAIGLRIARRRTFLDGAASASVLRLYQRRDRQLVEVLSTVMSLDARVKRRSDRRAWQEEVRQDAAVLVVSTEVTGGYRDLVKNVTPTRSLPYRWAQTRYLPAYDDFMEGLGLDALGMDARRDAEAGPWTREAVKAAAVAIDRRGGDQVYVSPDQKATLLWACSVSDGADFPEPSAYLITGGGKAVYLGDFRGVHHVRWSADSGTVIFEGDEVVEYGLDDVSEIRYQVGARSLQKRLLRQASDQASG